MNWRKSLQFKYLVIVLAAVLFIPISFSFASLAVFMPAVFFEQEQNYPYEGFNELTDMWHHEANLLKGASDEVIAAKLKQLNEKYKGSQMFWVDEEGNTRDVLSYKGSLPEVWTSGDAVTFMKKSFDADPFTVVAFIGGDEKKGFMVIKVDRMVLEPPIQRLGNQYHYLYFVVLAVLMLSFLFLSWFFFRGIHKRILRLKNAMEEKDEYGLPQPIVHSKLDEIGELEISFNGMIRELEESKKRELREEKIRKDLISNLSHDLRTPLTTIRAHLFSVKKEIATADGMKAMDAIDDKIDFLSTLIDNLLSYTLLSSGKYHCDQKEINLSRFIRKKVAEWYPVFEENGFEVQIDIKEESIIWHADPEWLERIMDNLMQNTLRHASVGKYIRISVIETERVQKILVCDKGKGFQHISGKKGAGIGLTIVEMMTKNMNLTLKIDSSEDGTVISIMKEI